MSIHCIITKARAGRVSATKVKEIEALVAELRANNAALNEVTAASQALRIMKHRLGNKKRQTSLQIIALGEIQKRLNSAERGTAEAALSVLSRDLRDQNAGPNVEYRYRDILGEAHALFAGGLEAYSRKLLGLTQNKAGLRNVVRELFGETTGDATAREMARSWTETSDYLRRRFNAAGGDIAERKDWGLPHYHDPQLVGRVTQAEWIDFIKARLETSKMIDAATGQPYSAARLQTLLEDTYESIRTDGLNKLTPGTPGGSKLANRHQEARTLIFRDAAYWMEYDQRFGTGGDIFGTLVGHMDRMSRETALLEILGPNPDATMTYLTDQVRKANVTKERRASERGVKALEDLYDTLTGRISSPDSPWWANSNQFLRNILTSAQLGGAFLSAISDIQFQRMTARYNGLSQTRLIGRIVKQFLPGSKEDHLQATRLGLVAEGWSSTAIGMQRWMGEVTGPNVSKHISDFVMRASMLSHWTQAGRWAFGQEFLGHLADNASKSFDAISQPLRTGMQRYGISAADWDIARSVPLYSDRGATFMRAADIAKAGHLEVAAKIKQMVLTETDFAVPTPSMRVRSQITFGTQTGTFWGEAIRNIALYKSFPVTLVHTHLWRGLYGQGSQIQKGHYLANLIIGTTLFGALSMQAKQIQRGKDPIDLTDPELATKFWAAAMVQGGGLGIFGDFLFADVNRFGSGPVSTAAGPVAGFLEDSIRLTVGNLQQVAKGEDTNVGREAVKYIGRYTPGSSLWYGRLAMERLILDQLQLLADPHAQGSFRGIEQKARDDFNQRYWWAPGDTMPERLPQLEAP